MASFLLTSFDIWLNHHTSNSSDDLLALLEQNQQLPPTCQLLRRLPVEVDGAFAMVQGAIGPLQPDFVICCGMAEKRSFLELEQQAIDSAIQPSAENATDPEPLPPSETVPTATLADPSPPPSPSAVPLEPAQEPVKQPTEGSARPGSATPPVPTGQNPDPPPTPTAPDPTPAPPSESPRILQTTLDLAPLAAGLSQTRISTDAGRFVCNGLYFRVLDWLTQTQSPSQALFVHVPRLTIENQAAIVADFATLLQRLDSLQIPSNQIRPPVGQENPQMLG